MSHVCAQRAGKREVLQSPLPFWEMQTALSFWQGGGGGGGLNPQGLILAWSQNLHPLPRLSFIGNLMSLNSLVSASKP